MIACLENPGQAHHIELSGSAVNSGCLFPVGSATGLGESEEGRNKQTQKDWLCFLVCLTWVFERTSQEEMKRP